MANTPPHRNWLITGGSSGMGLAVVEAALRRGDHVVALSRNPEPLKAVADDHPGRLFFARADIRDQAQVDDAVTTGLDQLGHFDVVVHSAGYGLFGAVEECSDADARAAFDTNVFGTLNLLRATLPSLRARRSGHIVTITAFRAQSSSPGMGLISAVNAAKEGIGDTLVDELTPLGIKVTMVEPGPSSTGFRDNLEWGGQIDDYDQTVREGLKAIRALPEEHFNQAGPIATAILAAVDADEPPVRLATGSVAVNTVRKTLETRLANLQAWQDVSIAVDGDPDRVCPFTPVN
jgi:NAD(P)-dependent dehydrogenase (short-subunit alcohol dehydrogenase family)